MRAGLKVTVKRQCRTGNAMLLSVSTGCSKTGIGSCPGSGTRQFQMRYTCTVGNGLDATADCTAIDVGWGLTVRKRHRLGYS